MRNTAKIYLVSRLLSFPFWGLFYLLPIILYKELGASALQVTTFVALKPLAALLSPYWSQRVHAMYRRLVPNLFWGTVLKFLPFLFFPFIDSPWYYIVVSAFHMALCRGTIPAWMEVLKINVEEKRRSRVCAAASVIDYLGVALLPLLFGPMLDNVAGAWRWLFPSAALLGIVSAWPIGRLGVIGIDRQVKEVKGILGPWQSGYAVVRERADFAKFQWGFFLGGAGLMIIQPILPKYFVDTLHLSYSNILIALATLKGIGFALSSPLWVRLFNRSPIFRFCAGVTALAALFPLLLLWGKPWLAYLLYGVMQGGSELSWKMSGPVFAGKEDSAPFSSVNLLTVGVRGLIFPYLGAFLFAQTGSSAAVLVIGALFSLAATIFMGRIAEKPLHRVS